MTALRRVLRVDFAQLQRWCRRVGAARPCRPALQESPPSGVISAVRARELWEMAHTAAGETGQRRSAECESIESTLRAWGRRSRTVQAMSLSAVSARSSRCSRAHTPLRLRLAAHTAARPAPPSERPRRSLYGLTVGHCPIQLTRTDRRRRSSPPHTQTRLRIAVTGLTRRLSTCQPCGKACGAAAHKSVGDTSRMHISSLGDTRRQQRGRGNAWCGSVCFGSTGRDYTAASLLFDRYRDARAEHLAAVCTV